jgi:Fe-S cluster biosynthesis and repair protein YggX
MYEIEVSRKRSCDTRRTPGRARRGAGTFFCGAGVSRARAKLPGFLGLAHRVLQELRALPDSPAQRLTETAEKLLEMTIEGVGGILAADRIFGLLEREFDLSDIERAVGCALRPQLDASLDAHRILLALSKGPSGEARLVTTNFDLLFEAVSPSLRQWEPSQLPDLRRQTRFEGIVHLHGMLDPDYRQAVGGRLVLSSAEFGRAYLAEGWATEFIRAAIERYRIVFIGYTADDPPVQYLLEALNRGNTAGRHELYAFQGGQANEAAALWTQKGVAAIAYSQTNEHSDLWETLGAWAERASNPERWRNRLLKKAAAGPAKMKVHERGQIAHLAATNEGARALAEAKRPLPAEWICVFDPAIRFGTPDYMAPHVDPFTFYGIDSDAAPPKEREGNRFERQRIPNDAVDLLAALPLDGDLNYIAGLRGDRANEVVGIPPRLVSLAGWFMRVCGEPPAMWWAAGNSGLHAVMMRNVGFAVDDKNSRLTLAARRVWQYLFEVWDSGRRNDSVASFVLNQRILNEGWTPAIRRAVAEHMRPVLTADRPLGALPPREKHKLQRLQEVVSLRVRYPEEHIPIEIPDSEIKSLLPLLRTCIEQASALEQELHGRDFNIPPIEPDPNLSGESSDRDSGFNVQILRFAGLFRKLLNQDRDTAMLEFLSWPQNDHPVFARLRVWAAGLPGLLDPEAAGQVLLEVSNRVFWSKWEQRDLLLVIANRWNELSPKNRKQIEARLRKGFPKPRRYDQEFYTKLRAYSIVERLNWLKSRGCRFGFDIDTEIAKAQIVIPPDWTEADGSHAADSFEGRGGKVHTDSSHAEFADTPIDVLIERALGAHNFRHRFLVERDPYAGLVKTRPLRVLAGLRRLRKDDATAKQGWTRFLQSAARQDDKPRLVALIARRLATIHTVLLDEFVLAAAYWLEQSAKRLFEADRDAAESLFDLLVASIAADPDGSLRKTASIDTEREWFEDAWNSAVRALVEVLFADPQLSKVARGLPPAWIQRADALRKLPGDDSRFALTQFAMRLRWLYERDPAWTERVVIAPINREGDERDAALAGFFNNARVSGELFWRLKPTLLTLVTAEQRPRQRIEAALVGLFITAWHAKTDEGMRFLSDEELRTVVVRGSEAMRTQMLRHVGGWEITEKLILLRDVWPLQFAARSAGVSSRLVGLAFDDEENFAAITDAILPVLSPIENRGQLLLSVPDDKQQRIFARFPRKVLELLWKTLPERSRDWPYNTGSVLAALFKAEPKLAKDPKFAELRQRQARAR